MASFRDRHGRAWVVTVTVGHLDRLKSLGLDLTAVDDVQIGRLYADPMALFGVLAAACEGGTREELADGLDGDALDRANDALWETVRDFFLRRPLRTRAAEPPATDSSRQSGGPPGSPASIPGP